MQLEQQRSELETERALFVCKGRTADGPVRLKTFYLRMLVADSVWRESVQIRFLVSERAWKLAGSGFIDIFVIANDLVNR